MSAQAVQTGPHEFRPLSRVRHRDKCAACYVPRSLHPVRGWVTARPWGDKSDRPYFVPERPSVKDAKLLQDC